MKMPRAARWLQAAAYLGLAGLSPTLEGRGPAHPAPPWATAAPSFPAELRPASADVQWTRIVALAPSISECLVALGLEPHIVGVVTQDDVEALADRPRVGGFIDPNPELIVGLRPSLVLAIPNPSNEPRLAQLTELGVPVLRLPGATVADFVHSIDRIAALSGRTARAEVLKAKFAALWRSLRARARPAPRVAAIYGTAPLVVAGPGSLIDTLLGALGAHNVVQTGGPYPMYSREHLALTQPELILDLSGAHGSGGLREWRELGAVRNGRIHALAHPGFLRPSPKLMDAMKALAQILDRAPPSMDESPRP